MTIAKHRQIIGRFIIISHLSIFVLIFILFGLNGFTIEELGFILRFLIPIKTIYIAAVIKFAMANTQEVKKKSKDKNNKQANSLYKITTKIFVYSHFILLAAVIISAALNIITFSVLQYAVSGIEMFFGTYIILIVDKMFKV